MKGSDGANDIELKFYIKIGRHSATIPCMVVPLQFLHSFDLSTKCPHQRLVEITVFCAVSNLFHCCLDGFERNYNHRFLLTTEYFLGDLKIP